MKNMGICNRLIAFFTLAFALLISASSVFAHADLLRSQPANGESLNQSPKTLELTFKKEMQAVSMNSITVTDQNGKRVDKNSVVLSEDAKQMRSELEDLGSGIYSVEWKGLSADDHTIKGSFTFTVELPANDNTVPTAKPEQTSTNVQAPMTHQMPMQESGTSWWQSAVRWLLYLAMMTLFGGFAFRLLVLKPSLGQAQDLTDEQRVLGFEKFENGFFRLTWLSLLLVAAAAFASLILQTSSVLDVSLVQAFAPSRLFQVLTETSYGPPWLLQIAAVLALCPVVFFLARKVKKNGSGKDALNAGAVLSWIVLGISAVLFLPSSLTGHARAAVSEYRFAIISDWLHLIGVGMWVGGLFHLALTLPKSIAHLQGAGRLCVVIRVIPLFSRVAIAATILLTLTGIYNSWVHVDSFSALWNTPYGQVLSLKIILFLPMLILGGVNSFILRPRADRVLEQSVSADEHRAVDRSFYRSIRVEAAIGVAVLLLAAILAFLPPARQHEVPMPMMIMDGPNMEGSR